ncbi:MAG: replicative DNA helicase [Candidatus Paceibacterota bacterium]
MDVNTKLPPQDIESEKSVLGSIMIDKHAISKVADSLFPQDFYFPAHQKIFTAMLNLFAKNEPIDILSVSNVLKSQEFLDGIGGSSYLADLINVVPSSSHIAHYAKSVREKRVLRDLIGISSDIHESVFERNLSVETLIDAIEQRIFSVSQKSQDRRYILVKDELQSAYERIEKIHQQGGIAGLRGVTTGFTAIDNNLSGFQKSDLIILGARPSLGKTTLALDFVRAAAKAGHAVGVFSLEMSKEQIIDRLISSEAQVPLWKLRTGRLSEHDFDMIAAGALDRLSQMKIIIDDTPSLSIMQIRSIARRLQAEHGLELLVIDYVQLIQTSGNGDNVVQQFTEISHGLKALARELNIPVLALSQLNRSVDNRESQIPKISDLRETGSWEQDADVVMLIYRKDRTRMEPSLEEENTASIIIAKHRNGPIGTVDVKFDPERVTFKEIDKKHTTESF